MNSVRPHWNLAEWDGDRSVVGEDGLVEHVELHVAAGLKKTPKHLRLTNVKKHCH